MFLDKDVLQEKNYIFTIKNSRQEKFYKFLIAFFYRTLTAYYI